MPLRVGPGGLPAVTLALLLLAGLLAGCAGQAPRPGPFSGQDIPPRVQLDAVPFYAQEAFQCGPAALAMMLNSQGLATTPEALRQQVYLPGREGSLQVEVIAAARSHGLLVYPLEKDLTAIITEVAAGNPVLVLQNLRFNWWPQWHFAVVTGYDLPAGELILHSGLDPRKTTAFRTFDNTWARGDRWARVILPPEQLPATAEPLAFVRAAYDLEQTGQDTAAGKAYAAATNEWPGNLVARFARANHALSLGNSSAARAQFERLLESHRDFAAGWNNFAVSLTQSGCPQAAQSAQACASRLAPGDSRFSGETELADRENLTIGHQERPEHCSVPACPVE